MGHINKQIINLFRFLWLTATLIFYQAESDADHSFTEKCLDKRVFNYFLFFILYREIQYIFSICFSRYKLFFIFLYILHLTSFRFMLLCIFKYNEKRKNTQFLNISYIINYIVRWLFYLPKLGHEFRPYT